MDQPSAFNKKLLLFCLKAKNSKMFLFHAALALSIRESTNLYFLYFGIIFSTLN